MVLRLKVDSERLVPDPKDRVLVDGRLKVRSLLGLTAVPLP